MDELAKDEKFKFGNRKILKDYLKISYPYFLDFSILIFFISYYIKGSIGNKSEYALEDAFIHGIGVGIFIIACTWYMYMQNEIYNKKYLLLKYKKYPSFKYLRENGFRINKGLFYEGIYRQHEFVVFLIPKTENGVENNYIAIRSFYDLPADWECRKKKERDLCGNYHFGELFFENNSVIFIPYDWQKINFENNFNALIDVFKREDLKPISAKEWLNRMEKNMNKEQ